MTTISASSASVAVAVLAVSVIACNPGGQPTPSASQTTPGTQSTGSGAQDGELSQLSSTVRAFLQTWLIDHAPDAALRGHLDVANYDERLVPSDFYDPKDYARLLGSRTDRVPLTADEANRRLATLLAGWRRPGVSALRVSLDDSLAGVSPDDIPDIWSGLRELKLAPLQLPSIAALTYRLTGPQTYDWIASDTVGFQTVIPRMIASGRRMNGVVCRVREPGTPKAWMLFMFWANDGGSASPDWKLVSLTPVPSQ